MEKLFGLIGHPLSHSFSKQYFTEKFAREQIADCRYELFPLATIDQLPGLLAQYPNLKGLNVTIPYKQQVLPFLSDIDPAARAIGAVNVLKVLPGGKLKGFNTDYLGFKTSLEKLLAEKQATSVSALVLGTGGASLAVVKALEALGIPSRKVSRNPADAETLAYTDIDAALLHAYRLLINTTPLGMSPDVESFPPLPYQSLGPGHILYDLVYNPQETAFMRKGQEQGATVKNGLEMLYEQAEAAWAIWQAE
jgi:shikimate dehydrogenase